MQVHNLVQGTPEWNAYRAEMFNASDAPAMLGISKYKTRTQLLDERKTGLTADVNSSTQKLFDDGHRFEALARPIAEQIVGEDLYPVTGSEGKLSASFDGLNLSETIAFEHKTLNDEIRACHSIGDLPMMYRVQMQQQLMVSGADKCLFLATSWDKNDNLLEKKDFWFTWDVKIANDILQGWTQFASDLETHIPTVSIEQPKAQAALSLPTLFIQAKGEITTNNMKEYGEALAKRLEEVRAIALVTDQDFADAKGAAKLLRESIEQAKLAKGAMLSQTATVGEAANMIDLWCEDMRLTALQLEKDVKEQDLVKKQSMIQSAQIAFTNLVNALEKDTAPIRLNISMPNFAEAIKGKSRYDKMQDAITTLVANSTITANQVAADIIYKKAWMLTESSGYDFLFPDLQSIIFKQGDDFKLLVSSRIENHKKVETEREAKIKADAESAAIAKVEADKLAKEKLAEKEAVAFAQAQYEAELMKPVEPKSPSVELRAVVVENQDDISTFLKSRNFTDSKYNEYRAVLVEFVKYQATKSLGKAA